MGTSAAATQIQVTQETQHLADDARIQSKRLEAQARKTARAHARLAAHLASLGIRYIQSEEDR